jgi:DNA (cytosine-5)-methyltransferase 1
MESGHNYLDALKVAEKRYQDAKKAFANGELSRKPARKEFIPPYSSEGFHEKWRKLYRDRPSWTLTAHLGKDTYSHIHYDSTQARAISPREAARLQSFPDSFAFQGNAGDMYRQIGNAVPPILARALGECILGQLKEVGKDAMAALPDHLSSGEGSKSSPIHHRVPIIA